MQKILSQLTQNEHGIYRSKNSSSISYPADGNRNCFLLEDNSYWFKHRNKCITSIIKRYHPAGPVIDVGGGNGYVTRGILDAGFDAILLEPGTEGAINGKTVRQIPTVICSTFHDAGFKASSIKAIGCFDVVEHIENTKELIDRFSYVLEPGGLLYVTVPAHNWLWSQSDVRAQHYRRYNKTMIEQLLSEQFEIIYFTYFFIFLSLQIFIFRDLPFRIVVSGKSLLSKDAEHGTGKGTGSKLINYFLKREREKIKKGKCINLGSSCLFVARKIN